MISCLVACTSSGVSTFTSAIGLGASMIRTSDLRSSVRSLARCCAGVSGSASRVDRVLTPPPAKRPTDPAAIIRSNAVPGSLILSLRSAMICTPSCVNSVPASLAMPMKARMMTPRPTPLFKNSSRGAMSKKPLTIPTAAAPSCDTSLASERVNPRAIRPC